VSPSIKRFVRHYLEMVAAMVVGMVVLGAAFEVLLELPDETAITLVEMAIAMTIPMVAWMRFRGHSWRLCNEMAAAMLIPAAIALVLFGAGVVENETTLLVFEHVAMFLSMLVAMLLRISEYAGHDHHLSQQTPA
jgi:glyoxylate carboligase